MQRIDETAAKTADINAIIEQTKLAVNSPITSDEIDTLDKLVESYLNKYDKDGVRDLWMLAVVGANASIRFTVSSGEIFFGNLMIASIHKAKESLFEACLALSMDKYTKTKSEVIELDDLHPVAIALINQNGTNYTQQLLKSDPSCFYFVNKHKYCLLNVINNPSQAHVVIHHLKECSQSGILRKEPRVVDLINYLAYKILYHRHDEKLSPLLRELIDHLKKLLPDSHVTRLSAHTLNDATVGKLTQPAIHKQMYGIDLSVDNDKNDKDAILRCANSRIYTLFDNPERCFRYLQHFNSEFARYCALYPEDKFSAECVNSDSIEWIKIHNLPYPNAIKDLNTPKKYSRLQEFLFHLYKANGVDARVIKWLMLIPHDIANKQIADGYLVFEGKYSLGTMIHGAFTHAIQTALIIYAIQDGYIKLGDCSLKELLQSQVYSQLSDHNVWEEVRDIVSNVTMTGRDAFSFHALIMRNESGDLSELAAFLQDSFIARMQRFKELFFCYRPEAVQTQWSLLSLLDCCVKSNVVIDPYMLKNMTKHIDSNKHPSLAELEMGFVIRIDYPVMEFKHQSYGKEQARAYEVTAQYHLQPDEALFLRGEDQRLLGMEVLHRMYFDTERECWAFNLPRGVTIFKFEFIRGRKHPFNSMLNERGLSLLVKDGDIEGDHLKVENDYSQELFAHLSINDKHLGFSECLKRLTGSHQADEIKKIINVIDPKSGNTLLHFLLQTRADSLLIKNVIEIGACVLTQNKSGESPLELLLARLNYFDYQYDKDLFYDDTIVEISLAVSQGELRTALKKVLTQPGVRKLAELALWKRRLRLLKAVIEYDQTICDPVYGNTSLMHTAVKHIKDKSYIEILCQLGLYSDDIDKDGKTPLYFALESDEFEIARLLYDKGARLEILTENEEKELTYNKSFKELMQYVVKSLPESTVIQNLNKPHLLDAACELLSLKLNQMIKEGKVVSYRFNNLEFALYNHIKEKFKDSSILKEFSGANLNRELKEYKFIDREIFFHKSSYLKNFISNRFFQVISNLTGHDSKCNEVVTNGKTF